MGPAWRARGAQRDVTRARRQVDAAALEFGFPLGPLALADAVGVDVLFGVHRNMRDVMGSRLRGAEHDVIDELGERGRAVVAAGRARA